MHAQQRVLQFYADHKEKGAADCKEYNDYREMMERKDIDTVCIATPDHWHAAHILSAVRNGKDVYCEKPLTHSIRESIEVMKAVNKHKRILQTGSQQRSMKEFRIAAELVRTGCIGDIDRVECRFGDPPQPCLLGEEAMEPGLDWNMWLGPAPLRPYNPVLSPRGVHDFYPQWRAYKEYGTGSVGDWGAHHLDIAQWGLDMDDSGPAEVRLIDERAALIYPNRVTLLHKGPEPDSFGVHFYGSEGEVMANRGRFRLIVKGKTVAGFVTREKNPDTTCAAEVEKAEEAFLRSARIRLYESTSHTDDFLACVKSRSKPVANEQIGGRTAISCHLINQLYFNREAMKWDPVKLRFAGGTGHPSWLGANDRDWERPKK